MTSVMTFCTSIGFGNDPECFHHRLRYLVIDNLFIYKSGIFAHNVYPCQSLNHYARHNTLSRNSTGLKSNAKGHKSEL